MVGRILKFCLYIIVFALIITAFLSFFTTIQAMLYPGQIPSIQGYKTVTNFSDKMNPAIRSGDLVIIKEIAAKNVLVGDIIVYKSEQNKTSIKRVTGIQNLKGSLIFSTKGDAEKGVSLNLVKYDKLLGKMFYSIPFVAFLVYFWTTIPGIISIVFIVIVCIVSSATNSRARKRINLRRAKLKEKVLG